MMKEKSRSPPKLSNGRLLLILACLLLTCKNTDSQGCVSIDFTLYYLGIAGTSQTARIRNHNQFIKNRKKRGKTIWK